MRGLLHRVERNKPDLVRLADFFKRPADAHVGRQFLAVVWRPFKSSDGGYQWNAASGAVINSG
jgi:hypothetical protein